MRVKDENSIAQARGKRTEFEQIIELLEGRAQRRGLPFLLSTQIHGYVIEVWAGVKPEIAIHRYGNLLAALNEAKRLVDAKVCDSLESAFEQELGLHQ